MAAASLFLALGALAGGAILAPQPERDPTHQSLPRLLSNPAWRVVEIGPAETLNVSSGHDRAESLAERAALRAYEGAPPVVPHETAGIPVQTCRACHAEGLRAGGRFARAASHPYLVNCTQCHVEDTSSAFPTRDTPQNAFEGLRPAGLGGDRFAPESPPTIPHPTFMRVNCVSCHGPYGYRGLRTDHPDRLNCVQCHVPQAGNDLLSPLFGPAPIPRPGAGG